jgi:ABC-type amino acid transport substrate-binding protein
MDQANFSVTRRRLVRAAGSLGAVGLLSRFGALAAGGAMVATSATRAFAAAGPNGIDPATYAGGDGSYAKYVKSGIRLGFEPNPGNKDNPSPTTPSGWNTDIVLEALKRVGITQYEFLGAPWETMVPGLQSSRFDVLMSDVHVTPDRVQIIDFTTPVYWYGDVLVVQQGNPANLHSWQDLAGHTVGVVRGYNVAQWLEQRTDLANLNEYPDDLSSVTDLAAGRIDALVGGDPNIVGIMLQTPNLPIEIVPDYQPQSDLSDWTRYGIRKGENDLNNVLSHALGEMFIDGTTLKILKQYGMGERNLFVVPGMAGRASA